MSQQILSGIRVLDLTNVLAGPFATLHLALMGAEVTDQNPKGRRPGAQARILPELNDQLMGTSFLAQNANKKSVTLNTKSPEGKEIFKRLVTTADVLVENFRPDVMGGWGSGYDTLKAIQPATRLLRHLGLRGDRAGRLQAGVRPRSSRGSRRDGGQRRRAIDPAAHRLPGLRTVGGSTPPSR